MADSASAPSSAPASGTSPSNSPQNSENAPVSSDNSHEISAKPAETAAKPESDDDEFDVAGEKIKRRDWKELQDLKKRRTEFDRAAHKKMQDAAEHRKELAAKEAEFLRVANALKDDPWAIHKHQGLTDDQLNELAEQRLVAQMKRAQMTPEQIELEQLKAERAQWLDEKTKRETTEKEARHTELKQKYVQQFDKQIADGMQKANLARTRETARKVAGVMAKYAAIGEQIDPYVAAQIVRDDQHTEVRHELSELLKSNPRAAIELLGPEVVAQIAKSQVQEARQFQPQKQATPAPTIKPPMRSEPLTFEEARKKLGIRGY